MQASGNAAPCVTETIIREIQEVTKEGDKTVLTEKLEIAKNVTALAYSGAADTVRPTEYASYMC